MEYTFTWFIENYSYCPHEIGEGLRSPKFFVKGLKNSAWTLRLFPRGDRIEFKGNVALFLERSKDDEGPDSIPLKFELWFLTADGSIFDKEGYEHTFKKAVGFGSDEVIQMHELCFHLKSALLPKGTLGVRCKMWINEADISTVGQGFARTRIGVEHISFIHEVEDFSSLVSNKRNTFEIESPTKEVSVTSSVYIVDRCCDGKIFVEITPSCAERILLKCNLFLLGASGILTKCGEEDTRFDDTRKDISKLKLSLTRKDILRRKSEFLPDDKLTLVCVCSFSTGVKYEKIESTLYEIPSLVLNQVNNGQNNGRSNVVDKLSACPSAQDDLNELYSTQLLPDVKIKTETKSYPAHRNFLCARSPVFKAILINDMKEKHTDCIEVVDLDNDTVEAFLHFLCSDNLGNIEWDTAMKLYFTADKYVIVKLKLMCSSILLDGLSTSNAIELLLLADTHSDSCLQEAVVDFILKPEEEVLSSDEWAKLAETHPVLVRKTMMQKYVRRNNLLYKKFPFAINPILVDAN